MIETIEAYKDIEACEAIPEAASMIETFRAIGYSLETAIADIIDNSITAKASEIQIKRYWDGGNSIITILDNGIGMDNDELKRALRPGAQNPLSSRASNDLGRFGLGLKTASFSQCRKLTVISKKNNDINYWTWDLDYVAACQKWHIIRWAPSNFLNILDPLETGTCVIWSCLDRIIPANVSVSNIIFQEKFSSALEKVRKHLGMTFHRFIEDKSISIIWGSHAIEPWNPFCPKENKRQAFPEELLPGEIRMKGYVLPHKSHFSKESEYILAEGPNGWNGQQGFYVYRGRRLLLAGDWLGLYRKEEHFKLARILIDLPNSQDENWQIDIKKSRAFPPANYRDRISQYAKSIRQKAEEVFRHRGKILKQRAGQVFSPLWLDKTKDGQWSYVVNRDNPIIQHIKLLAKVQPEHAIDILLKLVESSVPTKTIYINESKGQDLLRQESLIDDEAIREPLSAMYSRLIDQGKSPKDAKNILKTIEPFNNYEDLIDSL